MHRYNREPIEIGRLQRFAMECSGGRIAPCRLPAPSKAAASRLCGSGSRIAFVRGGTGPARPSSRVRRAWIARRPEYLWSGRIQAARASRPRRDGVHASLGVEFAMASGSKRNRLSSWPRSTMRSFSGSGWARWNPADSRRGIDGVVDALRFIADYKTAQTLRRPAARGGYWRREHRHRRRQRRGALGAWEVTIVYRRSAADMSAFAFEYEHARQEGVHFRWRTSPVRIAGRRRQSAALECLADGLEVILPCDTVIPAIGQSRPPELLAEVGSNVYAGGDFVNGGREVVDAVADGKRAALKCWEPAWLTSRPISRASDRPIRSGWPRARPPIAATR